MLFFSRKDQVYSLHCTTTSAMWRNMAERRSAAIAHRFLLSANLTQTGLTSCLSERLPVSGGGKGTCLRNDRTALGACVSVCVRLATVKYTMILLWQIQSLSSIKLNLFSCPSHVLYHIFCCYADKQKVQTLNPPPPWSNATTLTTKHPLSQHTTSPKVGWYDMSEYVDSCDLFLCQTSVSSPKTRDWWQDTKTHSNNKRRYWGGDWGIIINDEHAAGQRCSLKTSLLSPKGQNGASINWQAGVLEFLSWALVG